MQPGAQQLQQGLAGEQQIERLRVGNGEEDAHGVEAAQQHHTPGRGVSLALLTEPIEQSQGDQKGPVAEHQRHGQGRQLQQAGRQPGEVWKEGKEGEVVTAVALRHDLQVVGGVPLAEPRGQAAGRLTLHGDQQRSKEQQAA